MSGCVRFSQTNSRSNRTRTELTFQVAIFMIDPRPSRDGRQF